MRQTLTLWNSTLYYPSAPPKNVQYFTWFRSGIRFRYAAFVFIADARTQENVQFLPHILSARRRALKSGIQRIIFLPLHFLGWNSGVSVFRNVSLLCFMICNLPSLWYVASLTTRESFDNIRVQWGLPFERQTFISSRYFFKNYKKTFVRMAGIISTSSNECVEETYCLVILEQMITYLFPKSETWLWWMATLFLAFKKKKIAVQQ